MDGGLDRGAAAVLIVDIPGRGRLELEHLVLDMNGTLALDGVVVDGVSERLSLLRAVLSPVVLTADTHGGAARLATDLGIAVHVLETQAGSVTRADNGTGEPLPGSRRDGREGRGDEAAAKAAFVQALEPARVIAVGNGANDAEMLRLAAIGVCVLGPEGAAADAVAAADLVVTGITPALDLLLHPRRLVATLRR